MSDIRKYIELIESAGKSKTGATILTNFIKNNVKNKGLRLFLEYPSSNIMTATFAFAVEEPINEELMESLCETIRNNGSYDEVEYEKHKNTFTITIVYDEVNDKLEDIII